MLGASPSSYIETMHYYVYFRFYRHEIRKLGGGELIIKFMKYMRDTNGDNINNIIVTLGPFHAKIILSTIKIHYSVPVTVSNVSWVQLATVSSYILTQKAA